MIDPFYEYQSPLAAYTTPQQQVQVQAEKPPLIYREYQRAPPLYQKRTDERELYTYKPYKKLERWTERLHRRLEKYRRSREERYGERGISTRGIAFETGVAKGIVDIPLYGVAAVGGAELAIRKPREFPKYAAIGAVMMGKGLYRGFKKDPWETAGYLTAGILAGRVAGRVRVPRPRFGERIPSPRVEVVERGSIRMRPTRPKRGIYLREVIDIEKPRRGRPVLSEPKKLLTAPREPEWEALIREIRMGQREIDVRWAQIQRGWERLHARAEPTRARVRVKTATRPRVILQEMREPQVATLVKAKPRVMVAERVRLHPMFLEMKPAPKTRLALKTVPLILPYTKTKTKTITATQLLTKPKTETRTKTRTKTLTALMVMPITKTQAKTATRTAVLPKTQTLTRTLTKTKTLTIPKAKVVTFTGLEVKPPLLTGDWEKKYLRRRRKRKRRTIEWYIRNPIALLW